MNPDADAPYRDFAERRRIGSVLREELEVRPDGERRQWYGTYTWDAVRAALNDGALSPRVYGEVMGIDDRYGEILLGMDPPHHRDHRAVLQPSFARNAVLRRLRTAVERPVEELLVEVAPLGSADLLTAFCEPMPALVLARLLGLGDEDAGLLRAQAVALDPAAGDTAADTSDALLSRLLPVIRQRRTEPPTDDLVSVLAHATIGERALTDLEVFSHVRILAIAGTDTLSHATANLFFALLTHPEQLGAVRQDDQLVPAAVEEAVRWECPAVSVPRVAIRDTHVDGVAIPTGSAVRCGLGAANRDPSRWTDPDSFDVLRERLPNAGFGLWAHACLGIHLAHQVMEHAVRAALAHLSDLRLDPIAPTPAIQGQFVRAPTHLRACWG